MRSRRLPYVEILIVSSALAMAVALFLVFVVAPREAVMGDVQRIFYFHVSVAWVGYLAMGVAFVSSVLYLWRRDRRWDRLALSAVEIGLVLISGGIVTGSFWARATWGVWWTWEPRLTTSAVLWVMYAAYLALRRSVEETGRQARLAAVYGILAFVAVPINFMAIRWWRTVHPLVFEGSGANLSPAMLGVLVFCVCAWTLFFVTLLVVRVRLERTADHVRQLKRQRIS